MRISDWSSDVCSSDLAVNVRSVADLSFISLHPVERAQRPQPREAGERQAAQPSPRAAAAAQSEGHAGRADPQWEESHQRSEERPVGKEGVSKGRAGGGADSLNKKHKTTYITKK